MTGRETKTNRPVRTALSAERGAIGTRLAASLATAALLCAVAFAGSNGIAALIGPFRQVAFAASMPTVAFTIPAPASQPGTAVIYPREINSNLRPIASQASSAPVPAAMTIAVQGAGSIRTLWYVRDQDILQAFTISGLIWLYLLFCIWRPLLRRSAAGRAAMITLAMGWLVLLGVTCAETPVLGRSIGDDVLIGGACSIAGIGAVFAWVRAYAAATQRRGPAEHGSLVGLMGVSIGIGVITVVGAILTDRALRFQEEFLIAAVICLGVAAFVAVWLPPIARLELHSVRGRDGEVRVYCPKCGYSLVGLTELRCPECGERFTLDQIIAAQSYNGVERAGGENPGPP